MNLKTMVEHLSKLKVGTPGVDLFRERLPSSVKKGYLLATAFGSDIQRYTAFRSGSFRVLSRADTSDEALEMCRLVSRLLHLPQGLTIGDMNIRFILPVREPMTYPQAEGTNSFEASVDFEYSFTYL